MKKIAIVNGPNINKLGIREKNIYGDASYQDLQDLCNSVIDHQEYMLTFFQSNHEGEIIDFLHSSDFAGIVINPAAFSHTSIAIYDALRILSCPKLEVHLSNIYSREVFRHQLVTAAAVDGVISGLGINGYKYALFNIIERI